MKKEKYSLLIICAIIFSFYIVFTGYICSYKNYINNNYCDCCSVMVYQDEILQPLALFVVSIFITTLITFFISDKIFKGWLKFTAIYFAITALLVYLSPTIAGGTLGLASDKESVSMFMSEAFVIISIIMFLWMRDKEGGRR